jgi:uncharacterized membrane protein
MEQLSVLVVAFALYSMIGWVGETLYTYWREQRWVNRGFLRGPFFLLYGVGALGPILWCGPEMSLWSVAAFATVWAACVEYGGSVLLERIGLSYWDYADKPYNLRGRICLESISVFVVGLIALVYVFHPVIAHMIGQLSPSLTSLLATIFVVYALADGRHVLRRQLIWHRQTGAVRGIVK